MYMNINIYQWLIKQSYINLMNSLLAILEMCMPTFYFECFKVQFSRPKFKNFRQNPLWVVGKKETPSHNCPQKYQPSLNL